MLAPLAARLRRVRLLPSRLWARASPGFAALAMVAAALVAAAGRRWW
jgi:hypothetical protein